MPMVLSMKVDRLMRKIRQVEQRARSAGSSSAKQIQPTASASTPNHWCRYQRRCWAACCSPVAAGSAGRSAAGRPGSAAAGSSTQEAHGDWVSAWAQTSSRMGRKPTKVDSGRYTARAAFPSRPVQPRPAQLAEGVWHKSRISPNLIFLDSLKISLICKNRFY
jgi:hypothetical protein